MVTLCSLNCEAFRFAHSVTIFFRGQTYASFLHNFYSSFIILHFCIILDQFTIHNGRYSIRRWWSMCTSAYTNRIPGEYQSLWLQRTSENTKKTIAWSVKLFEHWRQSHNKFFAAKVPDDEFRKIYISMVPLEMMDDITYNTVISRFISECRKRTGENYPPNTLWQILVNLQGFIRSKGKTVSFLKDIKFKPIQDALDVMMKKASSTGLGRNIQADTISADVEEQIWDQGFLGDSDPKTLLDTMMFQFGYGFTLRASEHRALNINEKLLVSDGHFFHLFLRFYYIMLRFSSNFIHFFFKSFSSTFIS